MSAQITMPQQSDTMTEGTVVKWLKQEGEKVRAGEPIAEIETDKAVMEMEAFDGGTLAAVVVKEGQKVPVGSLLAVIATAGEKPDEVKQQFAAGGAGAKAATPTPTKPEAVGGQPITATPRQAPAGAKPHAAPQMAAPAPSHAPQPKSEPGNIPSISSSLAAAPRVTRPRSERGS